MIKSTCYIILPIVFFLYSSNSFSQGIGSEQHGVYLGHIYSNIKKIDYYQIEDDIIIDIWYSDSISPSFSYEFHRSELSDFIKKASYRGEVYEFLRPDFELELYQGRKDFAYFYFTGKTLILNYDKESIVYYLTTGSKRGYNGNPECIFLHPDQTSNSNLNLGYCNIEIVGKGTHLSESFTLVIRKESNLAYLPLMNMADTCIYKRKYFKGQNSSIFIQNLPAGKRYFIVSGFYSDKPIKRRSDLIKIEPFPGTIGYYFKYGYRSRPIVCNCEDGENYIFKTEWDYRH